MSDDDLHVLHAHAQLRNLYSRYCFGLDYLNDEEMLDCFTEDGVFALSDRGDFAGHDEIQAILDASSGSRNRHNIVNVCIDEVDGDRARTRAYFILLRPDDGATISYGHYVDDAVLCDDGQWRWTRKRVNFDWRSDDYAKRSESQQRDQLVGD